MNTGSRPSRPRCGRRRTGIALLLVLAALIIAVTAAVTAARVAAIARLEQRLDHCAHSADDLLVAAEAPIQHWLANKSGEVVLPPESIEPSVEVFRDRWTIDGLEHSLTITAWDQLGMVPIDAIEAGSMLVVSAPTEIIPAVQEVFRKFESTSPSSSRRTDAPGLDWFERCDCVLEGAARIYPRAGQGEDKERSLAPRPPTIGACVATHNPPSSKGDAQNRTAPTSFAINVNTAPIELVERCLLMAGRGGIERIIEARSQGKQANGGDLPRPTHPQQAAPNLVARSDVWALRIDIAVGPLTRSWWCVYANSRSRDHQWECLQRLVIGE